VATLIAKSALSRCDELFDGFGERGFLLLNSGKSQPRVNVIPRRDLSVSRARAQQNAEDDEQKRHVHPTGTTGAQNDP
jgi:hypothetical protein